MSSPSAVDPPDDERARSPRHDVGGLLEGVGQAKHDPALISVGVVGNTVRARGDDGPIPLVAGGTGQQQVAVGRDRQRVRRVGPGATSNIETPSWPTPKVASSRPGAGDLDQRETSGPAAFSATPGADDAAARQHHEVVDLLGAGADLEAGHAVTAEAVVERAPGRQPGERRPGKDAVGRVAADHDPALRRERDRVGALRGACRSRRGAKPRLPKDRWRVPPGRTRRTNIRSSPFVRRPAIASPPAGVTATSNASSIPPRSKRCAAVRAEGGIRRAVWQEARATTSARLSIV